MLAVYVSKIAGICFITLMLLLCGMPVFLALGLAGSIGLYLLIGESALRQLPFLAFKAVESFPLTCLPLFIIAGIIMEKGKVVDEVFSLFRYFAGNFISAPLITTILVGGFFCAISGSSVATTSLIAAVTLPILISQGYKKSISSGVVAGSTIGTVIPPSIGYILYGVITEESIGQLFVAGIIPAVMIFGFYCLYIVSRAVINEKSLFEKGQTLQQIDQQEVSWKDKIRALKRASWGLFAPVFVLGGIYMGIFTPTEAAAVMVMYAIVITILITKTVTWRQLFKIILVGAKVSSMILLIIVGARIFGALTSQLRIAVDLVSFVETAGISPIKTLTLISVMLIVLGMFLDAASIMVITLPVFYPVIMSAGFNSVWFGVFFIIVLEIGLLTPPVGLNLFVIKGLSGFKMETIIRGTSPFILIMLLSLFILTLFPQMATWLPDHMMR
jgi:C4-dicarboxylate transporter DctM subunit